MVLKAIIKDSDMVCLENTVEWKKAEELLAESIHEKSGTEQPPVIVPPILKSYPETPRRISIMQCRNCGGGMIKGRAGGRSLFGHGFSLVTKLIILVIGVGFLFIPVVGWIIGAILIVYALFSSTGAKNKKVWRCQNCDTLLERA